MAGVSKLDLTVAAAVDVLKGTGLRVAVVAWMPGLANGVQSIAIGSDHADEATHAFRLAHLVCLQGNDLSKAGGE